MNYKPKFVLGKINTSNITDEDVKEGCINQEEIEKCKEFFNVINGTELILGLWDYDNQQEYHIATWSKEYDDTMKEAYWIMENEFGCFNRCEFEEKWKLGEYDSGGSTVIPLKCVEVIKVLQE